MLGQLLYLVRWLIVSLVFAVGAARIEAQLVADPAKVDLGKRLQGQLVSTKVKLFNQGKNRLEIERVSADCSCTAATPARRELGPGESTEIEIVMETRAYQGELHRRVMVQTSEGDLVIPVQVRIVPFENWEISPYPLIMAPSSRGAESFLEVKLTYSGAKPVEITQVTTGLPWLKAVVTGQPGPIFTIRLAKLPEAPAGNHRGSIEVSNTDPSSPSVKMQVFVPVTASFALEPNPIIMAPTKVGQESTIVAKLSGWNSPEPLRLALAQGDATVTDRDGGLVAIRVTVKPTEAGVSTQLLRVYAGESLEAEIPVIVRADP